MAEYSIGASGGDFEAEIRRAQEAARQTEALNRAEEQRRAVSERTAGTEASSVEARSSLTRATEQLSSALRDNIGVLASETEIIAANTTALRANLELRRTIAATGPIVALAAAEAPVAAAPAAVASTAEADLAALVAERRAAIQRATEAVSRVVPLQLGPGRAPLQIEEGGLYQMGPVPGRAGPSSLISDRPSPRVFEMGAGPGWGGITRGGPAESVALPPGDEGERLAAYRQRATENAAALDRMAGSQREATQAVREAGAAYADTSTRLTRHGALTTEFIGALARGQVTLQEFGEQLTATIGKFGGWAIAAAAVYGVVGGLRDLLHGATETQGAIQNLGRFIPGLGGPAGGGTSQVGAAAQTLRDISTQFNVPISEVGNAMAITARVFHNLSDAADASRAVLAATRLDLVPLPQAEQYVTGISQGLGFTRGSQALDVVSQLNALQVGYGALVRQTLPGVARAAPAAAATGLDLPMLEALTATGVRAGLTGPQVGTGIIRAVTNFMYSAGGETTLRTYGIQPQLGQAGDAFRQIFAFIDRLGRSGADPSTQGTIIRNLATAVGGPQLGGRVFAPIFEQELIAAQRGQRSLIGGELEAVRRPRNIQEDLNATLSTVSERFKAIGIALQNFGSQLFQAGLLTPITGLLNAFTLLAHVVEALTSPLAQMLDAFNQLPGVVRDAVGVFVAFRALRWVTRTQLGGAAQQFIGRLPGAEELQAGPAAVQGIRGQLETYLLPQQRLDTEASALRNLRAQRAYEESLGQTAQFQRENAAAAVLPSGTPERERYEAGLSKAVAAQEVAADKAQKAEEEFSAQASRLAELEAQLVILKDRSLSWSERATFAEQQGYVASAAVLDIKQQLVAAYRAQLSGAEAGVAGGVAGGGRPPIAGGAVGVGGAGEAAIVGGAATAAIATARLVARDGETMREVVRNTAQEAPPGMVRNYGLAGGFLPGQAAEPLTENTTKLGALTERIGNLGERLSSVASFAAGPGAPLAALLGTQLIGGAIGGGVGAAITNIGGTAATGAIVGQMLGGRTAIGATVGTLLGAAQAGGGIRPSNLPLTLGAAGAVAGGVAGLLGGPFAEVTVPAGAFVGSLIGTGVGEGLNLLGIGGGGGKTPQQQQEDIAREANARVAQIMSTGTQAQQLALFQGDVQQNLLDMAQSGTTGTRAQATIQSLIGNLTAQQYLFGRQGPAGGGGATRQLSTFITAALGTAQQNPAAAMQALQAAQQPFTANIQQEFQANLAQARTPAEAQRAAALAQRAYQTTIGSAFDESVSQAQASVDSAANQMWEAIQKRSGSLAAAALANYRSAQAQLTAAKTAQSVAKRAQDAAAQSEAASALQQAEQQNAAQAGLEAARAGGNQLQALQFQHGALTRNLNLAQTTPGLSPAARQQAITEANTALTQNWTQQVQQQFAQVQAAANLAAAQATPPGDPIAGARASLGAARTALNFMEQHARAFDPTQILALRTQITAMQTQLIQAVADQAVQLTQLGGQMAAARDYGNQLAQAQDIAGAARQAVGQAVGPVARQQAQLSAIQAQNAVYDAQQQRVQEQGQYAQSLHPNDALAQAQAGVSLAQTELAMARGYDQRLKAQTDLNNAETALNNAVEQRIQAQGQLAQARTPNDAVRQAQIAVSTARQELAAARGYDAVTKAQTDLATAENQLRGAQQSRTQALGQLRATQDTGNIVAQARDARATAQALLRTAVGTDQVISAEQAMASANAQYRQALEQRAISLGALAASTTADPVKQLQDQLDAVTKALSVARGQDERTQLKTQQNQLKLQLAQTQESQAQDNIQFMFDMGEISASSAVSQLQALLNNPLLAPSTRNQIQELIRRFQLGMEQPLGGQAFDLAPGNIKLPTFYDVGRGLVTGQVQQNMPHYTDASQYSPTINVYVTQAGDANAVAAVLDQALNTNVQQRMRTAGVI